MLQIRRGEPPQTDPAQMSRHQLQEFVAQGGMPVLAALGHQALASRKLVSFEEWPQPLVQSGPSCQTVAFINGIRCNQAVTGTVWSPTPTEVNRIRRESGRGEMTEEIKAVANYLVGLNVLAETIAEPNPIRSMGLMAAGGFAVVSSGDQWHARTIVPNLAQLPDTNGDIPELVELDSIDGTQRLLSSEQFATAMLEQNWGRSDKPDLTLTCMMPQR